MGTHSSEIRQAHQQQNTGDTFPCVNLVFRENGHQSALALTLHRLLSRSEYSKMAKGAQKGSTQGTLIFCISQSAIQLKLCK